ncbi:hypothetical protein PG996_002293 [Apiospora saccharicola]|uniref:Uncharacterized protein n=1 Tax=Apiospora saccharicola TaxID=335842 RepID=A0ABR1WKI0_9PEZI
MFSLHLGKRLGIWTLYVHQLLKSVTKMLLAAYTWPVVIEGALKSRATGQLLSTVCSVWAMLFLLTC